MCTSNHDSLNAVARCAWTVPVLFASFFFFTAAPAQAQAEQPATPHTVILPASPSPGTVSRSDRPADHPEPVLAGKPGPAAPQAAANDDCANAIALSPASSCIPYSTTSNTATQSLAAITCSGWTGIADDDVWFKFTASLTAYRIEVQGAANMDAVVDLRQGPACNGTTVACADGTGAGGLESITYSSFIPGTTYYIRVYDYSIGWGDFTICIVDLSPPANDGCAAGLNPPYVLLPNASCTNGSVALSSTQAGETFGCISPAPTGSVWYSFIATQADMWVSIRPPGGTGCSPNFGLRVYRYTGACPPVASVGCRNYQAWNAQYVYNNLEMTGLTPGATYLVQVTQDPGCAVTGLFDFCIKVGTYLNCATCSSPCGPICTFAGYSTSPPPATVVSTCPGYPLGPPMNQFDTETNCYTFTAPNDTVWMQQVVWAYCYPQTYTFTYTLYSLGCGVIQSGSVFSNNMITGLVPGTNYRICYTLQASCSWDSLIYPYLYTTASVLPVELARFEAEGRPGHVLVTWTTASELNNREFVLERSSDARTFTMVGRTAGAGNSTVLRYYEMKDLAPFAGLNYYRLRQIDYDGTENLSQLVAARYDADGPVVTVMPNPVSESCWVRYFADKNTTARLRLVDARGATVLVRNVYHTASAVQGERIDLTAFPSGLYSLQVITSGRTSTVRLARQ